MAIPVGKKRFNITLENELFEAYEEYAKAVGLHHASTAISDILRETAPHIKAIAEAFQDAKRGQVRNGLVKAGKALTTIQQEGLDQQLELFKMLEDKPAKKSENKKQ